MTLPLRRMALLLRLAGMSALLLGLQAGCCSCRQHMKETADVKTRWVTGQYGRIRVEDGGLGEIPFATRLHSYTFSSAAPSASASVSRTSEGLARNSL